MTKKLIAPAVAALFAVPVANAAPMPGSVSGYLFHEKAEVSVPTPFGTFKGSDSSIGLGVAGQLMFTDALFGFAELQDAELSSMRLGGGFLSPLNQATQLLGTVSFVDKDADDGFGLHGGVRHKLNADVDLEGTLGYLILGDFDGLELSLGGTYELAQPGWSLVSALRLFSGSADGDVDFETTELRIGASYEFTLR